MLPSSNLGFEPQGEQQKFRPIDPMADIHRLRQWNFWNIKTPWTKEKAHSEPFAPTVKFFGFWSSCSVAFDWLCMWRPGPSKFRWEDVAVAADNCSIWNQISGFQHWSIGDGDVRTIVILVRSDRFYHTRLFTNGWATRSFRGCTDSGNLTWRSHGFQVIFFNWKRVIFPISQMEII